MKAKNILIAVMFLANATSPFAATLTLSPEKGFVEFHAKGTPSLLKITGVGKGPGGTLKESASKVSGSLKFELSTLSTGIELRDEHMKNKYLDTAQFPTAAIELDAVEVPAGDGEFPFAGQLDIKGVKKPVSGNAKVIRNSTGGELTAEFPIKLSDYPIGVPNYLGITVAEDVKVVVKSTFVATSTVATDGAQSDAKKQ